MAKRSSSIENISVADLQRELRRRERTSNRHILKLQKRREKIVQSLAELDSEIASLGGRITGGIRKRPRNDNNLTDALHNLLKNKTMSVTEAAAEVQKAGYMTTSPNFRTIVNQTLLKDSRFKRVGRGQYTSKG